MREVQRIPNARLEDYHGNKGGKDIRMLVALTNKLAWVRQAAAETGTALGSAEQEVKRQMGQVANGIPVTKSGGID